MGFFGPGAKDAERRDVWALDDKLDKMRKDLARDRADRVDAAVREAEKRYQDGVDAVRCQRDEELGWWRGRPAE